MNKSLVGLISLVGFWLVGFGYLVVPSTDSYKVEGGSVIMYEVAPTKIIPPVVEPPVSDPPPVVVPPNDNPPPPPPVVVPVGKAIPGGDILTAYVINSSGSYYIAGDMNCAGTCIDIKSSGVSLDLNGKTLVYNQTDPGEGVKVSAYNRNNITIQNGSIIQGAANSEGDQYGKGNNPILAPLNVWKMTIRGINMQYSGRDVGGIQLVGNDALIENNTLTDTWNVGTLKNRGQGVDAITTMQGGKSTSSIIRNNTIVRARHRGIRAYQGAQVYGNIVNIDSMATNASGINVGPGSKVWDNRIFGKGEHPIGIFYSEASTLGFEGWNNYIELQVTALGEEYSDTACRNGTKFCGNYANGFRTSWNGNNINFHHNTIIVRANARYLGRYNPTGDLVVIDGKARGIMAGADYTGQKMLFANNDITVIDETPGMGTAIGMGCSANIGAEITYRGNRVATNGTAVAFGDYYGKCLMYPIVAGNEFIKLPNAPKYLTFEAAWEGYSDGTGRVLQNVYGEGTGPDKINLWPSKRGVKSVYFGKELPDAVSQPDLPFDGTGAIYEYELHNKGATTMQKRML